MMTLLLVEDEAAIRDMIAFALSGQEFQLMMAETVSQAEYLMADKMPQLVILDWMLPDKSGIEFARSLKRNTLTRDIPIIMLTAKAEEEHKLKGLATADDYMTKPFSPKELIARIRTVLRRGPLIAIEDVIVFLNLVLNPSTREVKINNQILKLSLGEYQLLHFLITHQEKVYSREHLLAHVWGGDIEVSDRSVDAQVKRLRKVLAAFGYDQYIKTVRAEGYRFSK